MRTRPLSREEAKPRRPKSRPGPTPTLGQIAAQSSWVWMYCEARDCHHCAPLKLADAIARYGPDASSNVLRQRSRCTKCGAIGATLRLPSWVDSTTGDAPFPKARARSPITANLCRSSVASPALPATIGQE
jgi:hypothetical protein